MLVSASETDAAISPINSLNFAFHLTVTKSDVFRLRSLDLLGQQVSFRLSRKLFNFANKKDCISAKPI